MTGRVPILVMTTVPQLLLLLPAPAIHAQALTLSRVRASIEETVQNHSCDSMEDVHATADALEFTGTLNTGGAFGVFKAHDGHFAIAYKDIELVDAGVINARDCKKTGGPKQYRVLITLESRKPSKWVEMGFDSEEQRRKFAAELKWMATYGIVEAEVDHPEPEDKRADLPPPSVPAAPQGAPSSSTSASVLGAAIEIYRPGRFTCSGPTFNIPVIIDDKEVGRIQSGRAFTVRVAPGNHRVRGVETPPVQVEVKSGQLAFVRVRYDDVGTFCQQDGVGVTVMVPDEAQHEMTGLKPSDAKYIYASEVAPAPVAAPAATVYSAYQVSQNTAPADQRTASEESSIDDTVTPGSSPPAKPLAVESNTISPANIRGSMLSQQTQAAPVNSVVENPRPIRHPAEQIESALGNAEFPACSRTDSRYFSVRKSQITANDTGFGYALYITWWGGFIWHHDEATLSFPFSNLHKLMLEPTDAGFRVTLPMQSELSMMCVASGRQTWLAWVQESDAKAFVDAVNWMIWSNSPEGKANFDSETRSRTKQMEAWQAGARPAMPENAHEHQVLAENAVQEKNLKRAIDEYEAALDIFPTWPEGQFNVALICGETGDYDCAVEHMQDYLELVPNAPDAQAAKDKLIIWKDKLGQSQ